MLNWPITWNILIYYFQLKKSNTYYGCINLLFTLNWKQHQLSHQAYYQPENSTNYHTKPIISLKTAPTITPSTWSAWKQHQLSHQAYYQPENSTNYVLTRQQERPILYNFYTCLKQDCLLHSLTLVFHKLKQVFHPFV